ncbi:uncharacterized protein LOC111131177 [Crassostrea virginica]
MAAMRANMRPLYVTLELFGLSHPSKHSHVEPIKELAAKTDNQPSRLLHSLKKLYSIFVCCVLVFNVLRYLPSFWVGVDFVPGLTAQRIVILTWSIENAVTAIVLFIFYENKNHFAQYVAQYTTVISDEFSKSLKTNPDCQILRRCLRRALVVGWVMVIFNTIVVAFLIFSGFTDDIAVVLCNPFSHNSVVVKIAAVLLLYLSSGVWVFPIVLHYTLCTAIELRFQELIDVIEHTALKDCPNRFQTLKCVRYKHLQLCKMVETVDQSLSYYIANIYLFNIGNSCFLIYVMINKIADGPNLTEIAILSFWLASSIIITLIISIKSAYVNEKAHGLSSLVLDVNLDGATMQDIAHVNLLVAKLHGPAIGLSVLGIITITKEMILTLAGVFMTYLFLLIQFRI